MRGDGIGKSQGYPTANLLFSPGAARFASGVYAARAGLDSIEYGAALVVASSPYKVEVHLLGYEGPDFYGKDVAVETVKKVSEVISSDSMDLKEKIEEDIRRIREVLKS